MTDKLPSLIITHKRITDQQAPYWNLQSLLYEGGHRVLNTKRTTLSHFSELPLVANRIWLIKAIIDYFEGCLEVGLSEQTIQTQIYRVRSFIKFCENKNLSLVTQEDVEYAYFQYSENLYITKKKNGYGLAVHTGTTLSNATDNIRIHVNNTRLKKPKISKRALSREADKANLSNSSKLGWLIYDISENFDANCLLENNFPIYVPIRKELIKAGELNITSQVKHAKKILNKSLVFPQSQSKHAFNYKVNSECLFFLAMTTCNSQTAFNLKIEEFSYKPLGETYQVRAFKHRRQGEILFSIPKIYRAKFERYLEFLKTYATDSEWLFPHIDTQGNFTKGKASRWDGLRYLTQRYGLPWVQPRSFRKTGLNLLLRLTADESLVSELANHAVETFQNDYELPSQQRALVEITRFWDSNDPLIVGSPKVSLFNTFCNGEPGASEGKPDNIVNPDCLTPSGCFWCKHFRDEDSFDYIWNLHSYRFLKIIESSSYISTDVKPANLVIEQLNKKINWFNISGDEKHVKWIKEAEIRIEEAHYHPSWELKIMKYEA